MTLLYNVMNRDTVNRLVETYHECVASGEKASLFLETRNGLQFANLSVQVPVVKPGTSQKICKDLETGNDNV